MAKKSRWTRQVIVKKHSDKELGALCDSLEEIALKEDEAEGGEDGGVLPIEELLRVEQNQSEGEEGEKICVDSNSEGEQKEEGEKEGAEIVASADQQGAVEDNAVDSHNEEIADLSIQAQKDDKAANKENEKSLANKGADSKTSGKENQAAQAKENEKSLANKGADSKTSGKENQAAQAKENEKSLANKDAINKDCDKAAIDKDDKAAEKGEREQANEINFVRADSDSEPDERKESLRQRILDWRKKNEAPKRVLGADMDEVPFAWKNPLIVSGKDDHTGKLLKKLYKETGASIDRLPTKTEQ